MILNVALMLILDRHYLFVLREFDSDNAQNSSFAHEIKIFDFPLNS